MVNQFNENWQREGPWEGYDSRQKINWKGVYKNGVWHGLWEVHYTNSSRRFKGEYKNNKRRGLFFELSYNKQ